MIAGQRSRFGRRRSAEKEESSSVSKSGVAHANQLDLFGAPAERIRTAEPPEPKKAKAEPRKRTQAPIISDEIRAQHRHLVKHKHEWRLALRRSGIKGGAPYVVGLYLCEEKANNGTGKCCPKVETIVSDTDLATGTVKDGLKKLKKAGLLYAKKPRSRSSPDYFLALPNSAQTDGIPSDKRTAERMEFRPANGRNFIRQTDGIPSDSTLEENHGSSTMEGASAGSRSPSGGPSASCSLRSQALAGSSDSGDIVSYHSRERKIR